MTDPLQALLDKHGLTRALLTRQGRLPADLAWVVKARSGVVTDLHATGMAWLQIQALTGLSNGSIQRLTKAKGNPASKAKIKEQAATLGKTWAGKTRHDQLKAQWAKGDFDHQRGAKLSAKRRAKMRAGWKKPGARLGAAKHSRDMWSGPVGDTLRAFHADPAEKARRSVAQAARMQTNPVKYLRGRCSVEATPKGTRPTVRVRSSYEAAAIRVLEKDPSVLSYEYEAILRLESGKCILPDFLVRYASGTTLLEIKASWATRLPADHKVSLRLDEAKKYAQQHGWDFAVWTEKELAHAFG